jgi:hypothetical protein
MIYNSNIVIPTTCPLTAKISLTPTTVYPAKYLQRFGTTDPLHVQFLSSQNLAPTFYLKCYSALYEIPITAATATFTKTTFGAYYYWDAYLNFAVIANAISTLQSTIHYLNTVVYFTIETDTVKYMDFYPILVDSYEKSISLLYHNTANDYETVFGAWSLNHSFLVRLDGGFAPGHFKPGGDYEVFMNQKNEPTVTYAKPKYVYTLTLEGFDDLMLEKLNAILCLDTILIGGVQYCRDGELQTTLLDSGLWSLKVDLVPSTNRMTQNMEGDVMLITQDGTLLTNEDELILTISPTA